MPGGMEHLGLPDPQGQEVAVRHGQVHPGQGRETFRLGLGLHFRTPIKFPVQVMHDNGRPGPGGPEIVAG